MSATFWDEQKQSSTGGHVWQGVRRPPPSPDLEGGVSVSQSSMWVPPKNCARIAGIEIEGPYHLGGTSTSRSIDNQGSIIGKAMTVQRFFPLELSSSDYVNRVFRIVAYVLSMMCEEKKDDSTAASSPSLSMQQGHTHDFNKSTNGAASSLTSFLRICEVHSRVVEVNRKLACKLLMCAPDQTTPLMQSLVGIYQSEVSMATSRVLSRDQGRLSNLSELFRASRSLVNCLLATDRQQRFTSDTSRACLLELQRLEEQHLLHSSFKERRMEMLGWKWQEEVSSMDASILQVDASHVLDKEQAGGPSSLLRDASELQAQLRDLVKPSCRANILLLYRLMYIAQDLDVLMRTLADDGEYTEAQRIRDLRAAMDKTVTTQGRSFLELVEQSCVQAQVLAAELRSFTEVTVTLSEEDSSFSRLANCEDMIEQLLSLRLQLHSLGAPFSLLSQSVYVDLLAAQGSRVVDADFLFTAPHGSNPLDPSDPTSIITIGSLIIMSGSYSILNAVSSLWPNFTSLKTRESPNAHSFNDASSSQFDNMSPICSTDLLADNYTPNSHSYSGLADGLRSPLGSPLGRTAAAFFSQRFNDVGFSPAILNVLISFEELQLQLKELLELPSAALNELLLRFIGISSDLLRLSEMNISIGNLPESDRLLMLRDAVESSIDADLQDLDEMHASICGRGRSRLNDLDTLVKQVKVGRRELQRVAVRARLEKDFTGAQALDSVAADLSKSLNRLQQSMSPFSFLNVEDDLNISDVGLEINDRIARDGSGFITADFIFNFSNSSRHSIASLAVIAGAGAILRHIRNSWPGLTALTARGSTHNAAGSWDRLQLADGGQGSLDR